MKGLLAEFLTTNEYDRCGSTAIARNPDGIPIESEQYPPSKPDTSPLCDAVVIEELPKAKDQNSIHALTVAGIEAHLALVSLVGGTESFTDVLGAVYRKAEFAAGKTYKAASDGYNKLTRTILSSYGTKKQALYVLDRDLARNGLKEPSVFPKDLAGKLTTTGIPSDYLKDISILLKQLESLKKHNQSINTYLEVLLGALKSVSTVDTDERAVEVISKFNDLKKPMWDLPHHPTDTMSVSDVLPSGKVFKFEHDQMGRVGYSMSGDKPAGESSEGDIDRESLKKAIQGTEQVNEYLSYFAKQLTVYLGFVKRWGDAVRTASAHLEKTDSIGDTVKHQLDKLMDGPEEYLLFYSGFLPKVVSYTDRYVQDSIGLGGKLIN